MNAILAMTKRIVPAIATRGRIITMLLLAGAGVAVAGLLRNDGVEASDLAQFVSAFGLALLVPVIALVISTAALGSLVEDKTLVYFWLRPQGRWKIALAALVAGFAVLVPLILVPLGVLGAVSGEGLLGGTLAGAAVGLVAYTSIFTMLGLITKRALAVGLLYVFIWEGVIAGFSRGAGSLAISTYANGAMSHVADLPDLIDQPPALSTVIIVTSAIAAVSFAITTWRLNAMTVD